eukprot:jgi/Botrbrau1/4084/Bobra.152_3s0035.1
MVIDLRQINGYFGECCDLFGRVLGLRVFWVLLRAVLAIAGPYTSKLLSFFLWLVTEASKLRRVLSTICATTETLWCLINNHRALEPPKSNLRCIQGMLSHEQNKAVFAT